MPLPKRFIEPVHVARSVYQQGGLQSIELETVTNTTLTNIIRQLSSLSKHAEDVFCELARDVGNIGDRANSLQARIDRLAIRVTQLDSTIEEIPLTDITRKKAFKSAKRFDQQIFSRSTMPAPMLDTYSQCDKPPPLDKLNVYREDGKDGLKFYTDPNYFFELWRQEMLKDTERVMHDKGRRVHKPRQDGVNGGAGASRSNKKRVRTPHNTREKQRQLVIGHGETLMPNSVIYHTPVSNANEESGYGSVGIYDPMLSRPKSIELNHNYQREKIEVNVSGPISTQISSTSRNNTSANTGHYVQNYTGNENGIASASQVRLPHNLSMQQQQLYDDIIFNQTQTFYGQAGQGVMSSEGIINSGNASRVKSRPSQPPPAPPSNSSGDCTPNASSSNTPTRSRSMSTSRDILPPPPPIPEGEFSVTSPQMLPAMNENSNAAKLYGRKNSPSRACSPLLRNNTVEDANAIVLAQLNSTFENMNMGDMSQLSNLKDMTSLLPVSDQQSQSNAAPPPPPPPPPADDFNRGVLQSCQMHNIVSKTIINGTIHQTNGNVVDGGSNIVCSKKLLPPFQDTRTDLMKAIRDGITLRKVEKSEQKEIERNTALHDVASILARRVAIELSESEDSESDDDSEGWIEPNESLA